MQAACSDNVHVAVRAHPESNAVLSCQGLALPCFRADFEEALKSRFYVHLYLTEASMATCSLDSSNWSAPKADTLGLMPPVPRATM